SQPSFESASDESLAAPTVLRKQSLWNPYLVLLAISAAAIFLAVIPLALEWVVAYGMDFNGP
ncbi:MAG: hypothetical protein KDA61_15285, partial [Planctomycetales bacterium]|nr:hypothetical protein [Planctomycetales bacterium]